MEPYIRAIGIIGEAHRKIFHRLRLGVAARRACFVASELVSCGREQRTARDGLVYHPSIEIY